MTGSYFGPSVLSFPLVVPFIGLFSIPMTASSSFLWNLPSIIHHADLFLEASEGLAKLCCSFVEHLERLVGVETEFCKTMEYAEVEKQVKNLCVVFRN